MNRIIPIKWKCQLIDPNNWNTIKRIVCLSLLHVFPLFSYCQVVLNGDFENNSAVVDQINLTNPAFNSLMPNTNSFGTLGDLDILSSATYGPPQSGNWYIGLTGGGTDAVALNISVPLVAGNSYTLSFYDRSYGGWSSSPMEIGLSNTNNSFGSLIYTASSAAVIGIWTLRVATFVAPITGQFITVRQQGTISNWVLVDNFYFDLCDATITQAGPFCGNASVPSNLVAAQSGGTWSGNGIIDPVNGTFDPAAAGVGSHVITYNLPCGDVDTMTIVINSLPNSGSNGTLSICAIDPATDLFLQLGGFPDLGGTWSPIMTSGTGLFDPALDPSGTYTYTVTNSCGISSNNVVVAITANPSPGINGTASVCANAQINLFDSLGGSPDVGGIWSPVLTSGTGVFDPAADPAGTYTYSINDCAGNPQTATVIVTITLAPNTGIDGVLSICSTDPSTDLFLQLGGSPDIGGTWSPAMTSGTGVFDPALDPSGTYIYTVTNSCGTSSNNVVVTITANPSPGTGGTLIACSNDSVTDLFSLLGGTPSVGGIWSPVLTSGTGVFDPAADPAGTYTYSINDCAGNPQTATVIVTITPIPNTGIDGALSICPTDPSADLFLQLGGSPDLGGTWLPAMTSGTGIFDPATDPAGTYVYTVSNSCGSSNSNVVVTINSCTLPTASYTSSEDSICEGNCINFTDMSIGATSWLWTFNGASPNSSTNQNPTNICFDTSGTYIIEQIVTNSNGSDTASSSIIVNIAPIINAGNDVIIEIGQSTTLNATGTNGIYTWSPFTWLDCATCVSPISTPDETITYTVIVVDSNGCTASDQVTVVVDFDNVIWVPNIFSPNGDGNNDILFVRGKGVASFNFFLYDRWGEKVFETQNLDSGWNGTFNGKKMNNAVFVYYLQATFIDGSEVTQKGDITLIR